MTLRPFHQASWNEPILLELSTPGERGILPPPLEPELTGAGQDALSGLPDALRRSSSPSSPSSASSVCCGTTCGSRRRRWATT